MRVLISAYACEPGKGSEPGVGFVSALGAAREHEVWIITRQNNVEAIENALVDHPLRSRVHVVGVDLARYLIRVKRALRWAGTPLYYELWQRRIARVAVALDQTHDFDVVHHATFASNWTRIGVASVAKPLVIGPVGGAARTPWRLWPFLGLRGVPGEVLRRLVRPLIANLSGAKRAIRSASTVLVQNPGTMLSVPDQTRSTVLPNGLVGAFNDALDKVDPSAPESSESRVVFAGRLVGWKGAILAIEAMRYLKDPALTLHVYGSGSDQPRLERRVRRHGLSTRVEFHGSVPREVALTAFAKAKALVHPALHDESPLTVGEALSLGTPVVCLDLAGPPVLVKFWPDVPSRVVAPSSPRRTAREIAKALESAIAERGQRDSAPGEDFVTGLLDSYRLALEYGRNP
jgi:glycosyltransferase involved in cell wall biosynthesis